MRISIICFSLNGAVTASRLEKGLHSAGYITEVYKKSKYLEDSITENIGSWTQRHFNEDDAIIFVGACGIAVRSIAPYVACKKSDPAVIVIDECGKHVISLLSGHLGGANDLALKSAELIGAEPVVTTATDLHSQFAVDIFAKRNHCEILNMTAAKEVSAAILAGKSVGFYSEFLFTGDMPRGLVQYTLTEKDKPEIGIAVTIHPSCKPFKSTVQIIPRVITIGMGCRRNKEYDIIYEEAENCLKDADIYHQAIEKLTSISIKKDEEGLQKLAELWKVPFKTYDSEELNNVKGEFDSSEFVKKITGISNVCERSAVLGAEQGRLIKKKTGRNGVTTALALRNWEVHFE